MRFEFHKYQGTGNDFIMIHDRNSDFPAEDHDLIKKLCKRSFGIGADGLILLRPDEDTDFRMIYFNSDGKEGSMCGNGGRCAAAFAYSSELCSNATTFVAMDGIHVAKIINPAYVHLKMQSVNSVRTLPDHFELDTGSPHYVTFVDNVDSMDVFGIGQKIRLSNAFRAEGINVNFVEHSSKGLYVRTYERGVENETFSCGTGVVASAICASLLDPSEPRVFNVQTRGGDLRVSFKREENHHFRNIILEGPAVFVFRGTIKT